MRRRRLLWHCNACGSPCWTEDALLAHREDCPLYNLWVRATHGVDPETAEPIDEAHREGARMMCDWLGIALPDEKPQLALWLNGA